MRIIFILLIYLISSINSAAQIEYLADSIPKTRYKKLKKEAHKLKNPIFEDDKFIFTMNCMGEFGGNLIATDKLTNKQYYCTATCVIEIIKHNKEYYLLNSLSHLLGSFSVLRIKNPLNMDTVVRENPNGFEKLFINGKFPGSLKGVEVLNRKIEEVGIGLFTFDNSVYAISNSSKFMNFYKLEDQYSLRTHQFSASDWQFDEKVGRKRVDNTKYIFLKSFNRGKGILSIRDNKVSLFIVE